MGLPIHLESGGFPAGSDPGRPPYLKPAVTGPGVSWRPQAVRAWRSVPSGLGSTQDHPVLWRLGGILRRRWERIRLEDESTLTRPVGHPQQRSVG
jgi:hypothetical protein